MKKHLLLFCLFRFTLEVFAQPTATQIKTIDSSLTVLHERGMFNGVILMARNGKPVYKKAFGINDLPTGAPLTTHSAFNLASISKQFVAMMVMQLKEQGKLQFDD